MRLSKPATQNIDAWLSRLAPDVQNLLWRKSTKVTGARTRIQKISRKHLQMIERRASLDALACLTALLREAHELGHQQVSFQIARSICRILLMLGEFLQGHGVSRPLYEYYEELILPLSSWQGVRFSFLGVDFKELVGWLHDGLYHLKDVSPGRLNEQELMYYKLKLLNGNYGWDYMLLLNPIEVAVSIDCIPESKESQDLIAMRDCRKTILEIFRCGGDGRKFALGLLRSDPN